jgi:hypothetical protein
MGELTERAKRGEFGAFTLAVAYGGLGETDRGIAELHRAIDERDIFMPEVFFDPLLDPLRRDPEFRKVEERMGGATGRGEPLLDALPQERQWHPSLAQHQVMEHADVEGGAELLLRLLPEPRDLERRWRRQAA